MATLKEELQSRKTPYNKLSKEYKTYESYIVSMLINKGVLISSAIDREDKTYIAWTKEETISLNEYLTYAISKNWVDITKLEVDSQYSASSEVLGSIIDYIVVHLQDNQEFSKKMYKYLISSQKIKGRQICLEV